MEDQSFNSDDVTFVGSVTKTEHSPMQFEPPQNGTFPSSSANENNNSTYMSNSSQFQSQIEKILSNSDSYKEDPSKDEVYEAYINNLRFLHGSDVQEYYKHLCAAQQEEALRAFGKQYLDEFSRTRIIMPTYNVEIPTKPDNYSKMCDAQVESFKESSMQAEAEKLETTRKLLLEQDAFCPKCGADAKIEHTCKDAQRNAKKRKTSNESSKEVKEDEENGKESRRSGRARKPFYEEGFLPTSAVLSPQKSSDKEKDKKKRKKKENEQDDPSRRIIQRLHQEIQSLPRKNTSRIVIIGAGISGVAAGRELASLGHQVIILEARERIGGRIHTITSEELSSGCGIDIGAAFIHGIKGNPITKLCKALDESLYTPKSDCLLYDVDGKPIDTQLDQNLEKLFNGFLSATDQIRCKNHNVSRRFVSRSSSPQVAEKKFPAQTNPTVDTSLGKALNDVLYMWQKQKGVIKQNEWRILNWHFANIEGPCGADVSLLSLYNWDQDDPYEFEGDHCLIRQGYGHLINAVAQGLDIRLGHKVDSIDYRDGSVKIQTAKSVLEADAVIVTVPLGILKANQLTFYPPLPAEKLTAVSKLGFGLLNKLVLFFGKAFWDNTSDYFGYTSGTRGEFYLFINMSKVVGAPVLVAMISGQAAYTVETLTGEEVVARAMTILRNIFGMTVPNPTRAVITRWASDPFALGSFSYLAVGANGDDYDVLARPIGDKVFFAGEATNKHHPSTVSGAYMSGVRAAFEVAKACSTRDESSPTVAELARDTRSPPDGQLKTAMDSPPIVNKDVNR